MAELVFDNARVVLPDAVVAGHVVVRDGRIAAVGEGRARGEDLAGDLLIPGLVELHTDHIETHLVPRPKVRWNAMAALQAHDGQLATSGITTVFDAVRVGMDEDDVAGADEARELADTIARATAAGRLRAEHFIHLRCEVSGADVLDGFAAVADYPLLRLASLMDHAPDQRQFADPEAYRTYYQGKMRLSDDAFAAFRSRRLEQSERYAAPHRAELSARCKAAGVTLASHDDATPEHVAEALALGVAISEFPTTLAAAEAAVAAGLATVMGAPNVVRGRSHSGNVSAMELFRAGVLSALSSDYVPLSLLDAAVRIGEEAGLPSGIALVTANPAGAAGLTDRGAIAPGLRADLVRVRLEPGEPPLVVAVWCAGERIA